MRRSYLNLFVSFEGLESIRLVPQRYLTIQDLLTNGAASPALNSITIKGKKYINKLPNSDENRHTTDIDLINII